MSREYPLFSQRRRGAHHYAHERPHDRGGKGMVDQRGEVGDDNRTSDRCPPMKAWAAAAVLVRVTEVGLSKPSTGSSLHYSRRP